MCDRNARRKNQKRSTEYGWQAGAKQKGGKRVRRQDESCEAERGSLASRVSPWAEEPGTEDTRHLVALGADGTRLGAFVKGALYLRVRVPAVHSIERMRAVPRRGGSGGCGEAVARGGGVEDRWAGTKRRAAGVRRGSQALQI